MNRYRTTLRPAGGGGLPEGVGWHYVELPPGDAAAGRSEIPISRWFYGVIETDRELTPAELAHFDILEVPP